MMTTQFANTPDGLPDRITAIDFETATHKYDSACALAVAVINRAGVLEERRYWLIRPPGNVYQRQNIRIHGLTPDLTRNAPSFGDLWPEIRPYLFEQAIAAHYAVFDINVLAACLETINEALPDYPVYCSCIAARRAFPDWENHKLPTVCQKLNIPLLCHHNALEDAVACAYAIHRLRGFLPDMSWTQAKSFSLYQKEFRRKAP